MSFATTWVELAGFNVTMAEADAFDEGDVFAWGYGEDFACRTLVYACHDFHEVIFANTLCH